MKPNSPTKIQIYAFRHGQTDWNKEGRIQGHLDIPLNETGRTEALRLSHGFRHIPFGLILSSDLSRAVDTAKIALAEAHQLGWHPKISVMEDPRLRETHLGQLQGLTHSEIQEKFGKELSGKLGLKIMSDEELRDLGSESPDALIGRVMGAIADAILTPEFLKNPTALALSTHGGVLRRLLHFAGGIEEIRFSIPNGVFFPFEYDSAARTLRLQEVTAFSPNRSTTP